MPHLEGVEGLICINDTHSGFFMLQIWWLVVGTLTAHYVLIVHPDVLMSIIANVQCVHQQCLHWPGA